MLRAMRFALVLACAVFPIRCGLTRPSCTYSVTPSTLAVAPTGGPAIFNVSTADSCTWTAVSNASWISVMPALPPGRTGSRSADLTIRPNDGPPRTGSLTIAGQTVTVTQGAQ
jgi:hypothetical protein